MFTIDASVWVNSFDQRESGHEQSRQLLEYLGQAGTPIVVPNLVFAEVAGAISRTRQNPAQAQVFVATMRQLPNVSVIPLDSALAEQASTLAAHHGLRGADAIYAATALEYGCTLISLDREHLTRLVGVVEVHPPDAILHQISAPIVPDRHVNGGDSDKNDNEVVRPQNSEQFDC
jgi:predicted nucleic acid-binding protein